LAKASRGIHLTGEEGCLLAEQFLRLGDREPGDRGRQWSARESEAASFKGAERPLNWLPASDGESGESSVVPFGVGGRNSTSSRRTSRTDGSFTSVPRSGLKGAR
jgi:hypothetical protein